MSHLQNQRDVNNSINYARELGRLSREIKEELEMEKEKDSKEWRDLRNRYQGYTYPHEIINAETDVIARKRINDSQNKCFFAG